MKSQTFQLYFRSILSVLVLGFFVFVSLHPSFAQEQESSENPTPEISQEIPQEILPEPSVAPEEQTPEPPEQIVEEISTPLPIAQEPTPITPENPPQIEQESIIPDLEFFPQEQSEEEIPSPLFVLPSNLPQIRAFPKTRDFQTHREATHSCYIKNFKSDMTFHKDLSNSIIVSNPSPSASTIEISGLPQGFEIVFTKNNTSKISVATGQKEIAFTINKLNNPQKGNFSITFIYTQKGGEESITTCQMNLINTAF